MEGLISVYRKEIPYRLEIIKITREKQEQLMVRFNG